jgi:hypothetical protein
LPRFCTKERTLNVATCVLPLVVAVAVSAPEPEVVGRVLKVSAASVPAVVTRRRLSGAAPMVVGPPVSCRVADWMVAPAGRADRSNFR